MLNIFSLSLSLSSRDKRRRSGRESHLILRSLAWQWHTTTPPPTPQPPVKWKSSHVFLDPPPSRSSPPPLRIGMTLQKSQEGAALPSPSRQSWSWSSCVGDGRTHREPSHPPACILGYQMIGVALRIFLFFLHFIFLESFVTFRVPTIQELRVEEPIL